MIIRMVSGITAHQAAFEPNDYVDWQPDEEAQRLIKAGLAEHTKKDEVTGQKVKQYKSPPPRPEDAWPPKSARPVRADR